MNDKLFLFLHGLAGHSPVFDRVIVFLANDFGYWLIAAVVVFVIFHHPRHLLRQPMAALRHKLSELLLIFTSAGAAWAIVTFIKGLAGSPRPFLALPDVVPLFNYGSYESFPSGHATFYAALAAPLFFYHPALGGLFMIGAIIIGFARIVAGVHFPGDILAGWVLGSLIAITVFFFLRFLGKRFSRRIAIFFKNL